MKWPLVQLGDVCEFLDNKRVPVTEQDRKPGPYPYYGANGKQGTIDGYIFDEPLVLLAEDGGTFGSKTKPIAYQVSGKCWVNNHAHVLRATAGCDVRYLHRILSFYDVTKYINGTTRAKLTKGNAEAIPIPLPSLAEQNHIATLLEKADRLRSTRRYARQLSDTFLQSVFLEMFGDSVTNSKGWDEYPLEQMLLLPPHIGTTVPASETGKQVCVRVGEVGQWYVDLSACKFTSLAGHDLERFILVPGDIVLARAIGSESHLGKASLFVSSAKPVVFDSHVMRLRLNPSMLQPVFFNAWLRSDGGRKRFLRQARRTAVQFNINSEQMASLMIPTPPIDLQDKFCSIMQRIERLWRQQNEAERQAEHLFQTLLHRAFRGELSGEERIPEVDTPALVGPLQPGLDL